MIKTYGVHDHWTDINRKNDVDIMSVDGVITGIKVNGEDFSGASWVEVFSDDVTTTGDVAPYFGSIPAELSGADTIKVVFNNTEYIVNKHSYEGAYYYGATPGETIRDIDFSIYPFLIAILENETRLYTQAPGPNYLTILELQSGGGSSDFSTAEVTFAGTGDEWFYCPVIQNGELECGVLYGSQFTEDRKYSVLYTTGSSIQMIFKDNITVTDVTGDALYDDEAKAVEIWGDCTITIS